MEAATGVLDRSADIGRAGRCDGGCRALEDRRARAGGAVASMSGALGRAVRHMRWPLDRLGSRMQRRRARLSALADGGGREDGRWLSI